MSQPAFQDYYPDLLSHCYGCGRLNKHGLQIKSYWDGEEAVCTFHPKPYHMAIPGYVYGGLIASLIDCHATGTAAAACYRAEGREMDTEPPFRFLTASLHVDYVRPTPIDGPLELRAQVKEIKGRKVIVAVTLSARGEVCAKGEVVTVQAPEHLIARLSAPTATKTRIIKFYAASGEYGCFSNFAPYPIELKGKVWPTSEHYFQAQKFAGTEHEEIIRLARSPMIAARMGRSRKRPLRADWEQVKDEIMRQAVEAKFTQHADLRDILLGTGDALLVEHTTKDDYWADGGDGHGKNVLGKILVQIREQLKQLSTSP